MTDEFSSDSAHPVISVIIPARNVASYLKLCLTALCENTYNREKFEAIVCDHTSTDDTVSVAEEFGAKVIRQEGGTIAALRNKGAAAAKGQLLAFLDADCIPRADWLEQAVEVTANEPCVTGHLYDVPENAGWIERDWFCQRDEGRTPSLHLGGGNLIVPKELFTRIGGFDEELVTGEDAEFCARAYRICPVYSDDRIRVVHLGNPKTVRQFLRREMWYGLGAFGSFRTNWCDKPLLGTIVFAVLTFLQLIGVGACVLLGDRSLFLFASAGIGALVAVTVWYRRRHLRDFVHALRLSLLYYLYYLGRAIALYFLFAGKPFYHGIKESSPPTGPNQRQ